MRRILLAAVLIAACAVSAAAQSPTSRIVRLERWLAALARHEPGTNDDAAETLEGWSIGDLRTLSVDLNSLLILVHNPRATYFTVTPEGRRRAEPIRYTSTDLARLRLLARAAGGTLTDDQPATAELRRLAAHVREAASHGDGNYIVKRGAILHADAAMAGPLTVEPADRYDRSPGPRRITLLVQDGQSLDMGQGFVHWEIARFLLDKVLPPPAHDTMVGDFYRATTAWLLSQSQHDISHLEHARLLFPDDPMLLFLAGCQHEAFAAPSAQSVVHSVALPFGVTLAVESPGVELRRAHNLFRQALALDPVFVEARLRLGRVLGLMGRHREALAELQQVIDTSEPLLRYYAELFIGAEHEALRRFDAARESYERAAAINRRAQSPHLALSQLARRTGDRGAVLRELQQVFDIGVSEEGPDDPWWFYFAAAGRQADDLLERLWRGFRSESSEQP